MKAPPPLQNGNISSVVIFVASRLSYLCDPIIDKDSLTLQLHQIHTTCSSVSHRGTFSAVSTTGIKHMKNDVRYLMYKFITSRDII